MPQAPPARFSAMKRKLSELSNDGVSPVIATLLLVTLTVILFSVVAAVAISFTSALEQPLSPPEILAIESVDHQNGTSYKYTYAGNITVKNIGREFLWNSDYRPEFYVNGNKLYVELFTLNASDFGAVGKSPKGIRRYGLGGNGPNGYVWVPGASGFFDLTNKLIKPGDMLQIDIIRNSDGKVISRSVKVV